MSEALVDGLLYACVRCGMLHEPAELRVVYPEQPSLFEAPQLEIADDSPPSSGAPENGVPTGRSDASEAARSQLGLAVEHPKPPYRVPSMAEVRETPPNGLSVVSTFSGAGGSCLGFRMAGFRTLLASEFVPAAAETYRANFPGVPVETGDVRELSSEAILEAIGLDVGELDVLEGSPPCASFSSAGRREKLAGVEKKYSDVSQRTDDLFDEYLRLVGGLRPRAFVAENVAGFVAGQADEYRRFLEKRFARFGYRVAVEILDAAELGVPQRRRRTIIVGTREDQGLHPRELFPPSLPYRYSVRDAIDDLPPASAEELAEVSIERFAIGAEWRNLREGEQSERYFSLVLPKLDEPLPTLTATAGSLGAASVVHPLEQRKFTVAEAKRLSSFPDDFVLTGTYEQKVERLGRAVPPLMMRAVAERVRDALLASSPAGVAAPSGTLPESSDPEPPTSGDEDYVATLWDDEPDD